MKIKNAWIVFAATLLITLPTRIYQILFLVDQDTGFYTDGNTTTTIISIGLVAGIVLMIIMCAMEKREWTYSPIRSIPTAIICTLTGLGVIVQYILGFLGGNERQNQIPHTILSIVGILAGIVLIMTAYGFATGRNIFEKSPILSLIPSLWGCVCLITLFITYVSVVNVSENIYDTFTVIFILLFFFSQAKLFAGIDAKKGGKTLYMFGLPAVLMALVTGIPSAVLLFSGMSRTSSFPAGLHVVNILMALYIVAFLTAVSRFPGNAKPEDSAEEEKPSVSAMSETEYPAAAPKQESCLEFLQKAYLSEEIFTERVKSPFIQD